MENSLDDFLGKNLREDVKSILNKYGDCVDNLVRFGCNLIDWDLARECGEKKDGYIVLILFLRNFIETVDAINILIRHGASDPAKSLLRTAIENFFSMEFLLIEKQHERCMSFLVWNTYHNCKLYEKLDGTSEQAKQLRALFKQDKLMKDASPLVYERIGELKANAKSLLALPFYHEFVTEFERTKQKLKKANPYWYSLYDGPRNVEGLANVSKFPALYEVYRGLSNTVHGINIIQGKMAELAEGKIGIDQLRFPKDAHMLTQYAHTLCTAAFETYVRTRLPERIKEYQSWVTAIQLIRKELAKGNPINFN